MSRYTVEIGQAQYVLDVEQKAPNRFTVKMADGRTADVALVDGPEAAGAAVASPGPAAARTLPPSGAVAVPGAGGASDVMAPMPGVVLSLEVGVGDAVSRGQTLLVLEAMKMKNDIRAERDGVVAGIAVSPGDQVRHGDRLLEFAK